MKALLPLLLLLLLVSNAGQLSAADAVDFGEHVKPLLTAHCIKCHGPQKQESGLRLDTLAAVKQGGDNGPAVVAGKAAESRLIQAVLGKSEEISPMPPKEFGERLKPDEIALITTWVDQGAPGKDDDAGASKSVDHWSFKPRQDPPLPQVKQAGWVRGGIDAFVLANLEKQKLTPSVEADRSTLLRRLSLDLTGLPPTPAEVDAFLADKTDGAYERVVDRLLTSPHYGERWGRHWLDQARFADTDGYEKDKARPDAWRYRDWVIDAFNHDMPFDQFTIEQLAGDLLPDRTSMQLLATAFHRQTLTNTEGGADQEEFRVAAVVDRVNTTGAVWLGLTLGCAQCHSHKYDPISQREYYQIFAFFNGSDETNTEVPISDAAVTKYAEQKAAFDQRRQAVVDKINAHKAQIAKDSAQLEADLQARLAAEAADPAKYHLLEAASITTLSGAKLERQSDGSYLASGPIEKNESYTLTFETDLAAITAIKIEALTHKSLPKKGPGRETTGLFVLNEVQLYAAEIPEFETADLQPLASAEADAADKDSPASAVIDGKPDTVWTTNAVGKDHWLVVRPKQPIDAKKRHLQLVLNQKPVTFMRPIGRLKIQAMTGLQLDIPQAVRQAVTVAAADRTKVQSTALLDYYCSQEAEGKKLLAELAKVDAQAPASSNMSVRVLTERSGGRATHVLRRGDFLQPAAQVQPATLSILHPLEARTADKPDRLDLARWLVDPANPLTARVVVNRNWLQFFGRALVNSVSDFGTQGEKPANAELLDWLAGEWIRQGWSHKRLHKLIVMSNTYRQSSRVSPTLLQRDPYNVQLARQSRIRVEAELVRDLALAASGLLSPTLGGPSVRPRQPAGISELTYANSAKWQESAGQDRYRRGMYTFFQRTSPYPMLTMFDAPESILACTRRERSNTPLQALTLLNDPVFVECAQSLGRRIIRETPSPESLSQLNAARLKHGCKLCLGREPNAEELTALETLLAEEAALCQAQLNLAEQLAGSLPRPDGVDAAELAAWVAVGRTLLNLDEFINRE